MPLSEDAKKELQDAIRIVREDRFEAHARGVLERHARPAEPEPEPLLTPDPVEGKAPTSTPAAPPQKAPEPVEEKPKRKSAYWGELLDD